MVMSLFFTICVMFALFIAIMILIFTSTPFAEYKRNVKLLIKLLFQKGYSLEQIIEIINFYD